MLAADNRYMEDQFLSMSDRMLVERQMIWRLGHWLSKTTLVVRFGGALRRDLGGITSKEDWVGMGSEWGLGTIDQR